ncbi:hypothetical protein N5D52_19240 [Pseudomonas sp. GD03860]|uniref:hypothetical protein n=1 Tax=Pseudomonas sp. GD03860 TaxID=2975389 RepID=UPI0024496C44|nr:hypothetical protein [Pseudomonas sp. GD03860]MDH0639074.1 hypothetical protein [Pseudomonas sp. GD03860]
MTIDKQEIKSLALACDPAKCADEAEEGRRLAEFYSELTPEAVLALLAEIERLQGFVLRRREKEVEYDEALCKVANQRDQLKAAISSPDAVYLNMKSGAITKPTLRSMVDLYGEVVNGEDAQLLEIARLRAENEALRSALGDCAASLEGEMLQKFGGQKPEDMHPVTRRDYDRDMTELAGYRAAMAKEASR